MAGVVAVAAVAAKRPVLGVVWVDSAATVVCGVARAVVLADVAKVAEGVVALMTLSVLTVLGSMLMLMGVSRVAGWEGGWRSVSNDAASFGRGVF